MTFNRTGNATIDPDNDLHRRLDSLKQKLDQKKTEETDQGKTADGDGRGMAQGLKIASELVAAVLVGGVMGWTIDHWLGTSPFGLIVFLLLGFAAGILNVMRVAGRMQAD